MIKVCAFVDPVGSYETTSGQEEEYIFYVPLFGISENRKPPAFEAGRKSEKE
jgi:hypothetical protein